MLRGTRRQYQFRDQNDSYTRRREKITTINVTLVFNGYITKEYIKLYLKPKYT